ncbi:olfactory receptor 2G3-like [Eublepharis macularius]|uniref:Olfactory receptor n=1 Tax=Eublepharis macularius TaxID=481883 RepID=A0AA97K1L4_EUBMA|nr:olfactory receptor 2G3-like [Eublepharis macularius]
MKIIYQAESVENQSSTITFILQGFGNLPDLRIFLFILFLIIYALSIVGNLLIILLIAVDQHLHTPMYFFLMNLSTLETCYISNILPRMLASFLTGDSSISIGGCVTQWYFFVLFASTECYLLAMMSYDRYLAICKPLHYISLMNGRLCLQLASTSWMNGLLTSTITTSFIVQLTFCGPYEINHFFCDIYPVLNLSCSNLYVVKIVAFVLAFLATVPPFTLTLVSYICIILTILKIKSKAAQQKAFSTCSSHLIVVILFYGSLFIVYVVPETDALKELNKTFSLFYTVLTPMLNPLIYSLRNREVKEALCRSTRKFHSRIRIT